MIYFILSDIICDIILPWCHSGPFCPPHGNHRCCRMHSNARSSWYVIEYLSWSKEGVSLIMDEFLFIPPWCRGNRQRLLDWSQTEARVVLSVGSYRLESFIGASWCIMVMLMERSSLNLSISWDIVFCLKKYHLIRANTGNRFNDYRGFEKVIYISDHKLKSALCRWWSSAVR